MKITIIFGIIMKILAKQNRIINKINFKWIKQKIKMYNKQKINSKNKNNIMI